MSDLSAYILDHTKRSRCTCGKCIDSGPDVKLEGHTADVFFFDVSATNSPTADELKSLIAAQKGSFCDVNFFDGNEHGYMEIGGWIGDQQLALLLMGLGSLLGLWTIMQPCSVLGLPRDHPMAQQLAGAGMVTIKAR